MHLGCTLVNCKFNFHQYIASSGAPPGQLQAKQDECDGAHLNPSSLEFWLWVWLSSSCE